MPNFEYVAAKTKQEKKKVEHATIEELLYDVCDYTDLVPTLMLDLDGDGGIILTGYEEDFHAVASTLKEALVKFGKHYRGEYGKEYARFDKLDWGDAYG